MHLGRFHLLVLVLVPVVASSSCCVSTKSCGSCSALGGRVCVCPCRRQRLEYDPNHPDANGEGYVAMPNVNPVEEMVNMMSAARAYEAGVSAMRSAVQMAEKAISLGR